MFKSTLALSIAALATVADATTVAVLEFGKGGVVHRTSAASSTSTRGVVSFWKSIHEAGSDGQPRKERASQIPGMNVVPDLFNRPAGGVVVGIVGNSIDLESMPTVAGIVKENGAVAHMHLNGNNGKELMKKIQNKPSSAAEFEGALKSKAQASISSEGNKLESVSVALNENKDAADVDAALSRMLKQISKDAESSGSTIVVHLVVDDDNIDARRRLSIKDRKLEGDDGQNDGDDDQYAEIKSNYRYKTMFQIQYFNIVLWTALGLFGILFSANFMTMYMPLMPDTLLFGESAKMVAE